MELLNKKIIEENKKNERKTKINDIINNPICRGYFNSANYKENCTNKLYLESKEDKIYIAKRNNITYYEYKLSSKDIDFILTTLASLWSSKSIHEEISRSSRGKNIKIAKTPSGKIKADGERFIGLYINDITLIEQLDKHDCRRFYALLKELQMFGRSNKLVDDII